MLRYRRDTGPITKLKNNVMCRLIDLKSSPSPMDAKKNLFHKTAKDDKEGISIICLAVEMDSSTDNTQKYVA